MSSVSFNSQALPGTITAISRPASVSLRTAETLGRGGVWSQGGLIAPKRIEVSGIIKCHSLTEQAEAWDGLLSILAVGQYPLVIDGETGRRYMAEVESVTDQITTANFALSYDISFLVPSGTGESASEITADSFDDEGGEVVTLGNSTIYPRFEVAVSGLGTDGTFKISNAATGEEIIIEPSATGTYKVDADAETILRGTTDAMADWQSGVFPTLSPGVANTIVISTTGGLTISSAACYYRNRWR